METVKTEPTFILISGTKASRGQIIPLNLLVAFKRIGTHGAKKVKAKTSTISAGRVKSDSTTVEFGFQHSDKLRAQAVLLYSSIITSNIQMNAFIETSLNFLLYIPDLTPKIDNRTHIVHIDNLLCFTIWRLFKQNGPIVDYSQHLIHPSGFDDWFKFFCLPKEEREFPSIIDYLPSYAPGYMIGFNIIPGEELIIMNGVIGADYDDEAVINYSKLASCSVVKKRILFINKTHNEKLNANQFMKDLVQTEHCSKLIQATSTDDWLWYYNTYQAPADNYQHYILYTAEKFDTIRGPENALDRVVYSNLLSYAKVACNDQKRLSHYVDIARPLYNFKHITKDAYKCLCVHLYLLKYGLKISQWTTTMSDKELIDLALNLKISDVDQEIIDSNITIDKLQLFFKWYDNDLSLSKDPLYGEIKRFKPKVYSDISLRQPIHLRVDESMKRCINFVRAVIVRNLDLRNKTIIIVNDGGSGIVDESGNDGGGREVNNICNRYPKRAVWFDHKNAKMDTVISRLCEEGNVDKIQCLKTIKEQSKGFLKKNCITLTQASVTNCMIPQVRTKMTKHDYEQDGQPHETFDYGVWFSRGGDVLTSRWNMKDCSESTDLASNGVIRPHVFRYARDWTYIAPHHTGTIEMDQLVYQCYHGKYYYADSQFKEEGYVVKGIDCLGTIRQINMLDYFHLLTNNLYARKGEEVSNHKYQDLRDKITPADAATISRMLKLGLTDPAKQIMSAHTVWFIKRN